MINNLSQLKKTVQPGTRVLILGHCRSDYVGELREVNIANTVGIYWIIPGDDEGKVNKANGGRGSFLGWSNAPFWDFANGVCSLYSSDKSREAKDLIVSFQLVA